jgi:hypothetical protein
MTCMLLISKSPRLETIGSNYLISILCKKLLRFENSIPTYAIAIPRRHRSKLITHWIWERHDIVFCLQQIILHIIF